MEVSTLMDLLGKTTSYTERGCPFFFPCTNDIIVFEFTANLTKTLKSMVLWRSVCSVSPCDLVKQRERF